MLRLGAGGIALLFLTSPAYAHSPIPGVLGFYHGLLHPFSTPSQALLMLGLGLLAGGFEKTFARWFLLAFFLSLIAGLIGPYAGLTDVALYALAIVVSALAAVSHKRLFPLAVLCVAIGGYLIGTVSVPDGGLLRDRVIVMSGSFLGANLSLLYISGLIYLVNERVSWDWTPIAFRVAAAWIAAVSAIMLAMEFVPSAVATGI